MPAAQRADFTPLTSGNGVSLMAAVAGPDLAAAGWIAMLYGDRLLAGYLRISGLQH